MRGLYNNSVLLTGCITPNKILECEIIVYELHVVHVFHLCISPIQMMISLTCIIKRSAK